jgi:cytochrome c
MKYLVMPLLFAPLFALAQPAELKICMACHAEERKLIGPSFKDISSRYKKDANSVVMLTNSIRKGGSAKWGPIPMPAQPNITEEQAKALATWIMTK